MADSGKKQPKSAASSSKKDPKEETTVGEVPDLTTAAQDAQKMIDDAERKKAKFDKIVAQKKDELQKEKEKQENELAQMNAEIIASKMAIESERENMLREMDRMREEKRMMDIERERLEDERRRIVEEQEEMRRIAENQANEDSDDEEDENGEEVGLLVQENDVSDGDGEADDNSRTQSRASNSKSSSVRPISDNGTGYDTVMQKLYDEITKFDTDARNLMMDKWLTIPTFQLDGKTSSGFDSIEFSYTIAYQGFKPFDMACLIIKRMNKSGGNTHDIHRMVQIGSERGNNLEKLTKGASRSFLDVLKRLKTTYCLKSKAGKNPHAITLSRVCMSFPHVSCSYARINRNPIVHGSALDENNFIYPRQMMTAAFGSIIPNYQEALYKRIINAFYIYQYEFGIVVSPDKTKIKSAKASLPDLSKYLNAAITGSVMTTSTRINLLVEWDIILKLDDNTYDTSPTIDYYNEQWINKYLKK